MGHAVCSGEQMYERQDTHTHTDIITLQRLILEGTFYYFVEFYFPLIVESTYNVNHQNQS